MELKKTNKILDFEEVLLMYWKVKINNERMYCKKFEETKNTSNFQKYYTKI